MDHLTITTLARWYASVNVLYCVLCTSYMRLSKCDVVVVVVVAAVFVIVVAAAVFFLSVAVVLLFSLLRFFFFAALRFSDLFACSFARPLVRSLSRSFSLSSCVRFCLLYIVCRLTLTRLFFVMYLPHRNSLYATGVKLLSFLHLVVLFCWR